MKPLKLIFIFFFINQYSLLIAQVPDWALTHKHPKYPPELYIIGVGSATGDNAAESARRLAQSDIAMQLRVRIQSEVKKVQQTYELNSNEESFSDFRTKSTLNVDEQISGVNIIETKVDAGTNTTYALAVLNRLQFSQNLETELTSGWNQVADLQKAAEDFLQRGKLNEALQNLVDAKKIASDMLPKQAFHDAVSRMPFAAKTSLGPSALTSEIRNALSYVRINKKSGDNQKGKIGERFAEPFVVEALLVTGKTNVPVSGIKIKFIADQDQELGEAVTDATGTAQFSTTIRGGANTIIRAMLSLPMIGQEFTSNIASSTVEFNYSAAISNIAFALKITSNSSNVSQILLSSLNSAVTKLGYRIIDISRFVIAAEVRSGAPLAISGLSGSLYSINADVTISIADKQNGKNLGSIVVKTRGVGKSEAEALEKAANDIKINQNDLLGLLAKAIE